MFSWYYIEGILILTGVNLVTVLGLSLLTGFTGLFSFGHAGFMAIGAYAAVTMTMQFHMPFLASLVAGGIAAMIIAFALGSFTLNLKGDYFCIATLGFGEAIRLILDNVQYFGGSRGLANIPVETNLTNVVLVDILAIIALVFLIKSRHGRNMIAIREEELASQAIGINVFRYKMTSFVISALYAGIAGGLWAHYLGYIRPLMFQLTKSTELTIIAIIGGMGSITGSVVGTVLLTFLPELFRSFSDWRLVIYGAVVIFIMAVRPQGIMGGMELTDIFRFFKKLVTGKKDGEKRAEGADAAKGGGKG